MRTEWSVMGGASESSTEREHGNGGAIARQPGVGLLALSAAAVVGAAGLAHFDLPRGSHWREGAELPPGERGDAKDRASELFRKAAVFGASPVITEGAPGAGAAIGELPASWPDGPSAEQSDEVGAQRELVAWLLPVEPESEEGGPTVLSADELITELLTSATGRYSSKDVPALAESVATLAQSASIESETLQKIDHILQSARRHPEGDQLCVEVLRLLKANTMLFRIAALHEDRGVSDCALLALAEDHPAVASWLVTERTESFKNLLRKFVNRESNGPLHDLIEQMIAQHDSDTQALADARTRIEILDGLIEQQKEILAKAEQKQVEQEAKIAILEKTLAEEKVAVARAEAAQAEQQRQLDELKKKFEEEKRKNFVFIDDHSYRIVRQLTGAIEVASKSRNFNFRLPANEGELVLCVITDDDLNDEQKRAMPMRLKRDIQGAFGAEDKDVRKPLRHGDAWAAGAYVDNGERFYVKHENGRTVHVAFYVVVEEEFTL